MSSHVHCPNRKGNPRLSMTICRSMSCHIGCLAYHRNLGHLPGILRLFVELCLEDMAGAMGPVPEGK